jgi:CRISPR-associated protein Csd1
VILQALVKRYEDTRDVPAGWQKRDVQYAIEIDDNGILLGIVPLGIQEGKKNTGLPLTLPSIGKGRSGKKAFETVYFLCDDGNYMLGLNSVKFESAKKFYNKMLSAADNMAARAILAYFERGIQSIPGAIDDKEAANAKFVFQYKGKRIDYDYDAPDFRQAWERSFSANNESEQKIRCLVTGELDDVIELHYKVELSGVTMGKQSLISMNDQTSFRSYGAQKGDPPAQVGKNAAFAYATALNYLLKDANHNQRIGKDTLVYWADGNDETETEIFNWFSEPSESNSEKLSNVMEHIAQGKLPHIEGVVWDKEFYILCLSPNAARISIRFFLQSEFGDIIDKISQHYNNIEIYSARNEKFIYLPPWILLSETTVSKKTADVLPLLGGQLLKSIVTGNKYPATLYSAILIRIKAGEEINRTKAAIVKAVLIRNYEEREVTTVALNSESESRPYVLGRLFAVLERLQRESAKPLELNSTIRDSYFSSACTNPSTVFPTLLKLSASHSRKLGVEQSKWLEIIKTNLLGRIDDNEPFPSTLTLDEQGRFILGYYHQIQDFFTSKKDKEAEKGESNV